jgi:hypothetical protein
MRVDFNYLGMNKSDRPGRRFEHYIATLLDVLGCSVTFTGAEGTSEEGADFIATRSTELFPDRFDAIRWGVQCKCVEKPESYKNKIESQLWDLVRLRNCRYLLLIFATDPSDRLRKGLEDFAEEKKVTLQIWGKSELDRFAGRYDKLREWLYEAPKDPDLIESKYSNWLYHLGPNFASAIRIVGAADEIFPPEAVHVIPDTTPYKIPVHFQLDRDKIISSLEEEAKREGTMFYDGPHTRLIDFRATPVEETEQKHLELKLGPIGWYDYAVVNWEVGKMLGRRTINEVLSYVDLNEIAISGIIRNVKLSNILDTAITLVTSEGLAAYSQRSGRVFGGKYEYTSCVAENIHQVKDRSLESQVADELPAPFRTVLRGIREELSPSLGEFIQSRSIFLLGLSFDLQAFHPDLLYMVMLPLSFEDVIEMCRQNPGKDFIEGQIKAVPAVKSSDHLNLLLSESNWTPGGKASLIRAIEFLDAVQLNSGLGLSEVIVSLISGKVPYKNQHI